MPVEGPLPMRSPVVARIRAEAHAYAAHADDTTPSQSPRPPRSPRNSAKHARMQAQTIPSDPIARAEMISSRRVAATQRLWQSQLKKCEEVEARATHLADVRHAEMDVVRQQTAMRESSVRQALGVMSSGATAGAVSGRPVSAHATMGGPSALLTVEPSVGVASSAASARDARRVLARDCARRAELARRAQTAESEASLAQRRASETAALRRLAMQKVHAKRVQEEEAMAHRRQLEATRQERLEKEKVQREQAAEAKAEGKALFEKLRSECDAKVEAIASERRAAKEALAREREVAQQQADEARSAAYQARAQARKVAKEGARRAAMAAFAQRAEIVWRHAEAHAARCQASYEKSALLAERLCEAQRQPAAHLDEDTERLARQLEAAHARATSAREAFEWAIAEARPPREGKRADRSAHD